jgi:hypothetical protein
MKKKAHRSVDRDTMRPHYDFRGGVRGKYVARYRESTKEKGISLNLVVFSERQT